MDRHDQLFRTQLEEMLGGLKASPSASTPALIDALWDGVQQIVQKWMQNRPNSVGSFFRFVVMGLSDLVIVVETLIEAASTEDKKKLLTDAISYVYRKIDPNLPYIPEPIESRIEDFVLANLVPPLLDVIFGLFINKNSALWTAKRA